MQGGGVVALIAFIALLSMSISPAAMAAPQIPIVEYDAKGVVPADSSWLVFDSKNTKFNYISPSLTAHKFKSGYTYFIKDRATNVKNHHILGTVLDVDIPFSVQNKTFYLNLKMQDLYYGKLSDNNTNCYAVFHSYGSLMFVAHNNGTVQTVAPKNCTFADETYSKANFSYTIKNDKREVVYGQFPHSLMFYDIDSGLYNYHITPLSSNVSLTPGVKGIPEAVRFNSGWSKIIVPNTFEVGRDDKTNTFFNDKPANYQQNNFKESFLKGGVVGIPDKNTNHGEFAIQGYYYGTYIGLLSPLSAMSTSKTLQSKNVVKIGDTVSYSIDIDLPKFGETIFTPFYKFNVSDSLPTGLELVSVTTDFINKRFLTKTKDGFEFAPTDDWLANMGVSGRKLTLNITAKVTANANGKTLTNCMKANVGNNLDFSRCANPITVTAIKPSIKVTKTGDGKSSKDNIGTQIANSTVEFSYLVENTGEEPLNLTSLVDSKLGNIVCPKKILNVKESMVCKTTGKIS